jgi:protease-4
MHRPKTPLPKTRSDLSRMSDDIHTIERRRPWRRLFTFWRIMAIIVVGLLVFNSINISTPAGPRIARLMVLGVIVDDPARDALIAELAADDDVRAVIMRIDSPGGTTAGSEALYESLRGLGKPVVAVMGEIAASGGYIAALAADHVVARGNTLTGSIGVIAQYPQVSGLMDKLGVEMRIIRSGPLKAAPTPFAPASDAALDVQRALIADSYAWFRALVQDRRGLTGAALDAVSDGRVFTGRMALSAGLIDAIGDEAVAIAWLEAEGGLEAGLPIRDAEVPTADPTLLSLIIDRAVGGASLPGAYGATALERALMGPRLMSILD